MSNDTNRTEVVAEAHSGGNRVIMQRHKRTSIDIPQDRYDFVAEMIAEGKEKSMRDMLLKLLHIYSMYDVGSWRLEDGVLKTHMVRWMMMSDADMRLFEESISPQRRREIGLTMGKMWAEAWAARAETWDGDLRNLENWSTTEETWRVVGWGRLEFDRHLNRILVFDCVFTPETVAGVLEGLLGRTVKQSTSFDHKIASNRIYAFDIGPVEASHSG